MDNCYSLFIQSGLSGITEVWQTKIIFTIDLCLSLSHPPPPPLLRQLGLFHLKLCPPSAMKRIPKEYCQWSALCSALPKQIYLIKGSTPTSLSNEALHNLINFCLS